MKKMKKIVLLTLLSAFGLLAMWGVNSCSKFDNNALNTSVNSNIYLAPALIKFRNANTSSPIQFLGDSLNNYSFNCTITGPGAQYVVASDGSSLTAEYGENSFRTSNGVLALALVPNSIPSKSNPITFSINASFREKLYMSGKFAPISTSITITDTVVTVINVDVLELDRLVDGVAVTPNVNATLSAGTTTSDIIIPTTTNATMTEKATISIPTGTELKNAAGAVINASLATTNIVQYGAGSTTAAGVFPGSLEPKNVIGPDNKPIAGGVNFVSAGLLSINMVANDQLVKSFSKPLDVKMEIKSALNNFETDQPVKAGDSIPVWSLDETTGQWKYESKAAVTMNLSSNKLEANFKATHLSAWNLDWGWSMFGGYNTNNKPLKVNVSITDKTWVKS